jgi:Cu/Ag efflux pump CusA
MIIEPIVPVIVIRVWWGDEAARGAFLALFGVSVQVGVIMVEYINQLRVRGHTITDAAREGAVL